MKRFISLLLCVSIIMGAIPAVFAAPVLDVAESATVEIGEATLAGETGSELPIPTYDSAYGELIYFEDFEDGSTGGAYTSTGGNGYIWSAGNVVDNPVGDGKAFVSTVSYLEQQVDGGGAITNASEVTLFVDFLNYDSVTSNIPVCFLDKWLDPWNYWTNVQISKTEWTTMTVTKTENVTITPGKDGNFKFRFGGKGMYVDNIRVYAKYDLGTKVRLVDGDNCQVVEAKNGYYLPSPTSAGKTAWRADDGEIYVAGQLAPAGKTLVAFTEPDHYYHDQYGDLIFLEDFEDGTYTDAFTTGSSGYFYFDWPAGFIGSENVVSDTSNGGTKVGTCVTNMRATIEDPTHPVGSKLTLVIDFKRITGQTGNNINAWGYGSQEMWPAIQLNSVTDSEWTTLAKTLNGTSTLNQGNQTIYFSGSYAYWDNFKIYAKYDIGNAVRLVDHGIKIVELSGTTFTFPEFKSVMTSFWTDDNGNTYQPGDVIDVADCKGKTYTTKFVEVEEVAKLEVSASEITTDRGTVTVKPVISYVNGRTEKDLSGVVYSTDTANATVKKNDDGSVTVTGQMNGDVTITAILPDSITNKLESNTKTLKTTINISGQQERIVSSTFKVMMFGNSIRKHPPNESLRWTGNWGMAASSEDKDYAHRFIHYIEEKYGKGVAVLYDTPSVDVFENAFANKDDEADYTDKVSSYINRIQQVMPDIITLQFGDNAKNVTSAAAYENGVKQFVEEIKRVAPDAIVILSTPFFGGGYHIDGTIAAGEKTGVPVALVHELYTYENLAKSENPNLASGVDIHPGDRGMDNIAKKFFELVDPEILEKKTIEYATVPKSVEIEGENLAITNENGTLKLTAKVSPADAPQGVVWSLVSENSGNFATIDEDGRLSAINNGTVTVRATSRFNENAYVEADVTISGQTEPFTVTYDGNADNATVPEANEWAKPGFRLDNVEYFASRPGYKFLGWALEEDGDVVDLLDGVNTDTVVYAQWTVADSWDFEREGYKEDFTFENAFHQKVVDGSLSVTATDASESNVLKIKSPELMLEADDYYLLRVKMRNTARAGDTELKLTVTADGEDTVFTSAVSSVDFAEYTFELSGLSGTITGFEIVPTNVDCTIYVDSIRFLKNGEAEYSTKPAEYSSSYGNLVFFDNFSGEDFGNTADIVVVSPGAKSTANLGKYARASDYSALGDISLAGVLIKAADGESFKYKDGRAMLGTLTLVFEVYSNADKDYSMYQIAYPNPGGWDSWAGYYTNWGSKKAIKGKWTTYSGSTAATKKTMYGFVNSNRLEEKISIASVAVYLKPENTVTLVDGDKTILIDLEGLENVTLPETSQAEFNGWIAANGTKYISKGSVNAAELSGKMLTAGDVDAGRIVYSGIDRNEYEWLDNGAAVHTVKNDKFPEWDMSTDGTIRECIGWATTEDASETVDVVEVTKAGVTLYPVWNITQEAIEYEFAIEGTEAIEIDNVARTYNYSAVFTPDIPYNDVKWSVSDKTVATIDENGVLTPVKSGNVTVKAKAEYYPGKTASIDVVIDYKEGFEPVNVIFDGDVESVPASFEVIPGTTVDLGKYLNVKPIDANKRFNGWMINGDTSMYYTGEVEVPFGGDMYITAAVNYDINFALSQGLSAYYNGGTYTKENDMWVCTPGNKDDVFLNISGLKVPADRFSGMEWYVDVNYTKDGEEKKFKVGDQFNEFYFSTTVKSTVGVWGGMSVTGITEDGKYAIISMPISNSNWTGTITALRFDLVGNGYYGYNFRYVRFVEKPMGEEEEITLTDIEKPETGYTPDTKVKIAESFAKIDSVTWTYDEADSFLATGNFNENTVYTVTIKLSSKDTKYVLNEDITVTIDGKEADTVYGDDGAVYASFTYDKTNPFLEFDASIKGPESVTRDDRSFQYRLVLTNSKIPDKSATWSVESLEGEDVAVITEDGKLKAKKNGKVKITAVSNYNPEVVRELEVVIEDLVEEYVTISFDKATEAEVSGMPENEMTVLKGEIIALPEEIPEREGYVFLGWTDSVDSVEIIDEIEATGDKVICALWGTGIRWDFNNTADGFKEINGNGTASAGETYLIVKTTSKNDVRIATPVIDVDPARYNKLAMRMSATLSGVAQVYYGINGEGINGNRMLQDEYTGESLESWQNFFFDFSNVSAYMGANNVTRFWIDPFDAKDSTAYIDYIVLIDSYKNITFDANGGTLPEAYASGISAVAGTEISLTEKAALKGYEFICWSKTPDGTKPVFDFVLRDDETLYAVYGEAISEATESITIEEGDAILLQAEADTLVTITYETSEGTKKWSGKTNENGYAIAVLEAGAIENISVSAEATATLTTAQTAYGVANAEKFEEEYEDESDDSSGDGSTTVKDYDRTVVDVTTPGTIIPEGSEVEKTVASELLKGEEVVAEFDEAYEKNLFSETSAVEQGSSTGGVLSYRVFSKKPGAKVTPTFVMDGVSIDTTKYNYIVLRARQTGFDNPILRIFFKHKDIKSYTKLASVFHEIDSEYAVYVYDMSANKNWYGIVESLKLVMENNSNGTLDIDWIMFTDKIPEDTTELDKVADIFETVRNEDASFKDVPKNRWSYSEICQSYKKGFVNGRDENNFAPFDNVTLAEAITVAVRINHIFNELPEVEASASGNWYDSYVEAAIKAKIVRPGQFTAYNRPATRREVAIIMSKCVPTYYLNTINMFEEIPDVAIGSEGEKQILRLYCAGVLTGADENYSFLPETNITREEFAAIANRVALPGARKRIFTDLERLASRKVYEGSLINSIQLWSCTHNNFAVGKDGIARTVSQGTDPIVLIHTMTGKLNGKEIQKVKLGVVWNKDDVTLVPQLYYATSSANSFAWQRMFQGTIGETDENGVTEVVFDVTTQSAFQDTITQLRFDPFDLTGFEFGLAYVIIE